MAAACSDSVTPRAPSRGPLSAAGNCCVAFEHAFAQLLELRKCNVLAQQLGVLKSNPEFVTTTGKLPFLYSGNDFALGLLDHLRPGAPCSVNVSVDHL